MGSVPYFPALAAQADVIATGDSDLLVLHPWQGIQILNAADAVDSVQNDSKRQRRK